MCTFFREKIEEHLKEREYGLENQYGFTKGGRTEHCLFTLYYIAIMAYESRLKEHKNLFYIFIDYKKAYDTVNRGKLIEVLIKYKVNTKIIDMVIQMYENYETTINLGRMKEKI